MVRVRLGSSGWHRVCFGGIFLGEVLEMKQVPFHLEERAGAHWVVLDSGVEMRASEEMVTLWNAYQEALQRIESLSSDKAHPVKKGK